MAVRQESLPTAAARPRREKSINNHNRAGWLLSGPFFVLYFLFLMWPVLAAAWKSLFNDSLAGGEADFRGLANYGELLGDGDWWAAMWHTTWFTILSTVPLVLVPLGMALL